MCGLLVQSVRRIDFESVADKPMSTTQQLLGPPTCALAHRRRHSDLPPSSSAPNAVSLEAGTYGTTVAATSPSPSTLTPPTPGWNTGLTSPTCRTPLLFPRQQSYAHCNGGSSTATARIRPSPPRRRFSVATFAAARRTSQRRKQSSFWQSFEKYTDFSYSCDLSRSGSLYKKRRTIIENALAIQEEKCNGDVRFANVVDNATTGEPSAAKGSNSYAQKLKRRKSGYGITITSDSTAKMRCRQRKQLFIRRNKVCDLSLLLGLLGLILVVIDSELTALSIVLKDSPASIFLRSLCVLSTVALCFSLINYHRIEVKIALIDSGADDWRVAITGERIVKLSIELAVCAICPFPGSGQMNWPYINPDNQNIRMMPVPLDVLLSVPMFLRAYLLCRFMVLHSKQFQDAATRSIAALNRISMDFRFVIKTMMSDHPLTVLVVFTVSFWICMSWMFTQCERYRGEIDAEHYYLNSLWFIMVTFMSIGYGDIVPSTYCGRMLSISTGIVGAGVSSALIAVISRKLELSRAEKHVNNFMADSKLTNQRKNAAASVLQHTWFIHKYQNGSARGNDLRLRQHQRKFLNSINEFRRIKWDQRKLQEKGNSLLDVGKMHNEMHETMWEMHRSHEQLVTHMDTLTQRVNDMYSLLYSHCQQPGQSAPAHLQPVQPLSSQSPVPQSPPVLMPSNRRPQSPLSPGSGPCGCSRYSPNPFRMPPTSAASSVAHSTGPPSSASTLRVPTSAASGISQSTPASTDRQTMNSARSTGTPFVNGGTLAHADSSERHSARSSPLGSGKEYHPSHTRQPSAQGYESEDASATSPLIAHEPV